MADRWERDLPCRDVAGRPRGMKVVVADGNQIGLLCPPGELALMRRDEIRGLQEALTSAVIEATHREAESAGAAHVGD